MRNELTLWRATLAASLILCIAGFARGQGTTGHAVGENIAETQFSAFPGLPSCTPGSVKSGDPAKGPSIILAKADTGCTVPWHWHSPNEHLMMVKGVARLDMKSGKPITLRAGGYAMLPGKHVHRFVCTSSCIFYVHSDGAFDIHYVNDQGNEISPDEALKPASDSAGKKKK
jgi:quercetin dioxygenase-like cupin family protein